MACETLFGAVLAVMLNGCSNDHPAASAATVTVAAPAQHLKGRWEWTLRWQGCREAYVYDADGTEVTYSNEEVSKQRFTISPEPNASGFYELKYSIESDNGRIDCGGNRDNNTGQGGLSYVRFHESGDMILICKDTGFKNCVGPLLRVQDAAEAAAAAASPTTAASETTPATH